MDRFLFVTHTLLSVTMKHDPVIQKQTRVSSERVFVLIFTQCQVSLSILIYESLKKRSSLQFIGPYNSVVGALECEASPLRSIYSSVEFSK